MRSSRVSIGIGTLIHTCALYGIGMITISCFAADIPAPWGDTTPPNKITLNLVSDCGRCKSDYFGEYGAELYRSNAGRSAGATVHIFADRPMPRKQCVATWLLGGKFEDGECVPFGGQIYRWTINEKLGRGTFERIPEHLLAVPPGNSVGVVSVMWNSTLMIKSQGSGLIPLTEKQVGTQIEVDREKICLPGTNPAKVGSVQLKVWYHNGDSFEKMDLGSVTNGKALDIGPWAIKVERIVFPDLGQNIPGWVDLRVQEADPPKPQN